MKQKISKITDFAHGYLMETGKAKIDRAWGPKYRWEHTLRVAHWAWRLAVEEEADIQKCVVAALFHDVSHFVSEDYRRHGEKSEEIAKEFLAKEGYTEEFINDVGYTVRSHVGEANPKTLESKILQDADTLDRFGYFRILLFGKEAELSDLEKLKHSIQSFLEYLNRIEKGEFGPMWTKTGETKLKQLIEANKSIEQGILDELENTKRPSAYL